VALGGALRVLELALHLGLGLGDAAQLAVPAGQLGLQRGAARVHRGRAELVVARLHEHAAAAAVAVVGVGGDPLAAHLGALFGVATQRMPPSWRTSQVGSGALTFSAASSEPAGAWPTRRCRPPRSGGSAAWRRCRRRGLVAARFSTTTQRDGRSRPSAAARQVSSAMSMLSATRWWAMPASSSARFMGATSGGGGGRRLPLSSPSGLRLGLVAGAGVVGAQAVTLGGQLLHAGGQRGGIGLHVGQGLELVLALDQRLGGALGLAGRVEGRAGLAALASRP
jgi:hypothetical protein